MSIKGRKDGKPPYDDGVYRSLERIPDVLREQIGREHHAQCEPMFVIVEQIQDVDIRSIVGNSVKEINAATQRLSNLSQIGQDTVDQKIFVEAQVAGLVGIIEELKGRSPANDSASLDKLKNYIEGSFLKYVRSFVVKF